jgi:hypothetical protein
MNNAQFRRWQKMLGWTNPRTARELRVSERQVTMYRNHGTITPQLALLCELLSMHNGHQKKV